MTGTLVRTRFELAFSPIPISNGPASRQKGYLKTMKRILLVLAVLLILFHTAFAEVIAQWNFNSPVPDGNSKTGTNAPAIGTGTAALVGGVQPASSGEFVSGDTHADPAHSTDNSAWNTSKYPASTDNDLTAGVRFNVPTTDHQNIAVSWSQYNSGTASRYARLRYTLNGTTFANADVIAIYADGVYTNKTVDLSAIPGAANNPAFGFQIVTEFESSATGSGASAYVPTDSTSTYSGNGTIHFDMVTVSGNLIPGANTPPHISSLDDQILRVNHSTAPLPVTIWDSEDAAASLTLNAASSDPAVVPPSNIRFGGADASRTVTISAASQPGVATVTVYVIDTGGKSNSTSFQVTVLPLNTPPAISTPPTFATVLNTATPAIPFTVCDLETPAGALTVSASSGNLSLLPNAAANIAFGGADSNRTVTLTPAPGQSGVAPITLAVSDGTNVATSTFAVLVAPSPSVLFYDPFSYPDGSLRTNSACLWDHRSGVEGECVVTNGRLQITAEQTEDVIAPLIGGPYAKGSNTVLYAAFKACFVSLPKPTPAYFAHFADGSNLRGRIYATSADSLPGCYHLLVANGSDTNVIVAANLSTNTFYTFVTRYDLDAASTTLWINPALESGPGVSAQDLQSAIPIASYGFRQDADLGATILVDDLRVGLSFASVISVPINSIPITIQPSGRNVVLRWTDSRFTLQSAATPTGPFTNVPAASNPFSNPVSGSARFFRLKSQ
jgi:hypothetical protein